MTRFVRWREKLRRGKAVIAAAPVVAGAAEPVPIDDASLYAAAAGRGIAMRTEAALDDGFDDALWQADAEAARQWLTRFTAVADAHRDDGRTDLAAAGYGAALRLAPWRTDLKIQRGNMLKDGGLLPEAERLYREALADSPEDADLHLQLGHVLKLMGRRPAALAQYRVAVSLGGPAAAAAHLELVQAGETAPQREAMRARIAAHGVEGWIEAAARLAEVRASLDALAAELPELRSFAGIPAEAYGQYRRLHPVPPPEAVSDRMVWVLADFTDLSPDVVHAQLRGLRSQRHRCWRLIASGASPQASAAMARLALGDPRLDGDGQAQAVPDDALIVSLGQGAVLQKEALGWFAHLVAASSADLLFSDEVVFAEAADAEPVLVARWAFDPEAALQRNVIGDSFAMTAATHRRLAGASVPPRPLPGATIGLAAVEWGLAVRHVPLPLVERRGRPGAIGPGAAEEASVHIRDVRRLLSRPCAIAAFGDAPQPMATVQGGAPGTPLRLDWQGDATAGITVIVATRDNAQDCARLVGSLQRLATRPELLTCLVCDNGTRRAADAETLRGLAARAGVRVMTHDVAFNWSWLNNHAAAACDTPLLVFANDDMEMLTTGWDEVLRGQLARPHVGAVGAKLLYPDETIQHAGILFGWQGSVIHDGLYEPRHAPGQDGRWQTVRRVSAVTGAFLAIRRDVFERVGGFDAREMPVGYSDVDLALRLREEALAVVYCPLIELLHDESKSRGLDHLDPERQARARDERAAIEGRWGAETFAGDPSVNPVWLDATLPFRLLRAVPADAVAATAAWPAPREGASGDRA